MVCRVTALGWDANDPVRLSRFWSSLLGWPAHAEDDEVITLVPTDDTGFTLDFAPTAAPKRGQNRTHLDLTSASPEDQRATVARACSLGARPIDIGQRPDEPHVVLADPEGNEFCVIEPGNAFLADCGTVGAVVGDGTRAVGYFWQRALGWPLVWDRDEETAIRSPHGGPKFIWGGPPLLPKFGKNRLHFDIAPPPDGDQAEEVARLIALGATPVDIGQGDVGWVVLADPDGNEFCVLRPR